MVSNPRARAELGADAVRLCQARAAASTGTHALLLDGCGRSTVSAPRGVACWTNLRPAPSGTGWTGAVCTDAAQLPFGDGVFCAVWVHFAEGGHALPELLAGELARILAAHGVLLAVGVHPQSLWRSPSTAPGRWERALRAAGLEVVSMTRFGAPWPRAAGTQGLPHWLVRALGGAWLLEARHSTHTGAAVLRPAFVRRLREPAALLPDASARRQRA